MIGYEKLAERHILEHRFRQRRLDEAGRQDRWGWERDDTSWLDDALLRDGADWRQASVNRAGPMGLIDIVAQDLESFVELFEQAPHCDIPKAPSHGRA